MDGIGWKMYIFTDFNDLQRVDHSYTPSLGMNIDDRRAGSFDSPIFHVDICTNILQLAFRRTKSCLEPSEFQFVCIHLLYHFPERFPGKDVDQTYNSRGG